MQNQCNTLEILYEWKKTLTKVDLDPQKIPMLPTDKDPGCLLAEIEKVKASEKHTL